MKFLPSEYQSIKAAIETVGLPYTSFSFVKRKGRLHVHFEAHNQPFIFFRKVETRLDESRQWTKHTVYLIGPKAKQQELSSWLEVMSAFEHWLQSLTIKGER